MNNLRTATDEEKIITDRNCVFIIANERNCYKCFHDACTYLQRTGYGNYATYFVIVMNKDYGKMLPMLGFYKEASQCAPEMLFYFTTGEPTGAWTQIYTEPTPQMMIKTGTAVRYISYSEFRTLTGA